MPEHATPAQQALGARYANSRITAIGLLMATVGGVDAHLPQHYAQYDLSAVSSSWPMRLARPPVQRRRMTIRHPALVGRSACPLVAAPPHGDVPLGRDAPATPAKGTRLRADRPWAGSRWWRSLKTMVAALSVMGLRKRYGSTVAVDGVDLTVAEGEIFGILGPNGSGKTTTVECAQGLRKADGGTVRVFGIDSQAHPEKAARLVGIQLQHSELPDRIKVWEALHLFASLSHNPADEGELLAQWDLAGKRRATFASLSGGQRQRLLVALALVTRPRLVFLDEMTTGLDPSARREAWQVIEQVRRQGTTVVLVTHFMDEAERLCDRACVLVNGAVVAEGSPAGLVARYGGDSLVRFDAPPTLLDADLRQLPGVSAIDQVDGRIEVRGYGAFLTALGAWLSERGFADTVLSVHQPSLEDVYLRLVSPTAPAAADGRVNSMSTVDGSLEGGS